MPHKVEEIAPEAREHDDFSDWEVTMRAMEDRAKNKTREKETSEWDSVWLLIRKFVFF